MASSVSMQIKGASRHAAKLRKVSEDLGRSIPSLLRQEARAFCVAACFRTRPYGFSEEAAWKFRIHVEGDIRKVYADRSQLSALTEIIKPRSQRLAMAFWKAAKQGKTARANRYLREAGITTGKLDPTHHRAARTGPAGSVAKGTVPTVVVNSASLRKYIRTKRATVGTAKAGWYHAAKGLGGRVRTNTVDAATGRRTTSETIPGWIRKLKPKSGLGGARVSDEMVEVFTHVRHAREALEPADLAAAESEARDAFLRALNKSFRAALKRRRLAS